MIHPRLLTKKAIKEVGGCPWRHVRHGWMVVLGGATSGLFAPVLVHLAAVSCKNKTKSMIHYLFTKIHKNNSQRKQRCASVCLPPTWENHRAQNLHHSRTWQQQQLLSRGKERSSRVKAAHEQDIQTIPIKSIYCGERALYLVCS